VERRGAPTRLTSTQLFQDAVFTGGILLPHPGLLDPAILVDKNQCGGSDDLHSSGTNSRDCGNREALCAENLTHVIGTIGKNSNHFRRNMAGLCLLI